MSYDDAVRPHIIIKLVEINLLQIKKYKNQTYTKLYTN